MLIDTHCHVHFNAYKEDSDEVIRRAFNNGVKMITVGTDAETSAQAVAAVSRYKDGIWAAIGMHPSHTHSLHHDDSELSTPKNKLEEFDYGFYKKLAGSSDRVVAIGECGLDFYRVFPNSAAARPQMKGILNMSAEPTPYAEKRPDAAGVSPGTLYRIPAELNAEEIKAKQVKVFKEHISLATELNLPLIVHVRDGSDALTANAHRETVEILRSEISKGNLPKRGVIHCFTSNWEDAKRYLDLGFMISFTGTITFPPRKGQTYISREAVRQVPLENILIETDSPYLAPPPHRGERNEPSYVRLVAEKIAEIKGIDFEVVARQTTSNAKKLFNI